ncbi:hypothetical protein [Vibrio lentus]|uniref:hypothetical protein n=1 Tax=Vibrio lentus TaxID=136468 RepID=UPI001300044B|nr:hypothetical protein [Vibrio lentus]MCB5362134.1 hypothetical protein [Vibrio lentus]MCB5452300.1 hypothetical protein [Vibrio lentus]MCB5464503.1 hypothetical protein [Vibrio lentus]MCC4795103.1 hypothetical protein [Vibrio lentus]MCC4819521.1 hypothetical protein [Vibrio lentus]
MKRQWMLFEGYISVTQSCHDVHRLAMLITPVGKLKHSLGLNSRLSGVSKVALSTLI